MIRLVPGGPFTAEKAVTPEIKRNLEAYYGMNKPLYQQYLDYCGKLLHGDLGPSFKYPTRSVNEIIGEKLPVSIELGSLSLAIALGIGLPLGVLAAVWRNTWIDKVCSSVAVTGICIPTFVLGPLLSLIFAIWLGWFDASGWLRAERPGSAQHHPRPGLRRLCRPADPGRHARGPEPGLHPDGARQGGERDPGRPPPRPAGGPDRRSFPSWARPSRASSPVPSSSRPSSRSPASAANSSTRPSTGTTPSSSARSSSMRPSSS